MNTEETRTPEQEIEHLRTLNHRLSMQLVGMSDRLQESAKQIAADAWDAGHQDGWWDNRKGVDGATGKAANPYRKETP